MSKEYLYSDGLQSDLGRRIPKVIRIEINEDYEDLDEFKEKANGGFYLIDESGPTFNSKGELKLKIPNKILNLALGSKEVFVNFKCVIGIEVGSTQEEIETSIEKQEFFKRNIEVKKDEEEEEIDFCSGEKVTPASEFKEKICKRLNQRIPSKAFCKFQSDGEEIVITETFINEFDEEEERTYVFSTLTSVDIESVIKVTYHKKIKTWSYDFIDITVNLGFSERQGEGEDSRIPDGSIFEGDSVALFDTGHFKKEEACDPYTSESFISQMGFPNPYLRYYYIPSKKEWVDIPFGDPLGNQLVLISNLEKENQEEEGFTYEVKEIEFGNNLYFKLFSRKRSEEEGDVSYFVKQIDKLDIKTASKYKYKEFLA